MKLIIHTTDSAPEGSRPVLDGIAADLGLVPNLAATIAESPTLLTLFDGMRRSVGAGTLAPVLREVAGLATGVAVDNHYGVAFHSTMLDGLGVAASDVDRMRSGEAPQDDEAKMFYALAIDQTAPVSSVSRSVACDISRATRPLPSRNG